MRIGTKTYFKQSKTPSNLMGIETKTYFKQSKTPSILTGIAAKTVFNERLIIIAKTGKGSRQLHRPPFFCLIPYYIKQYQEQMKLCNG